MSEALANLVRRDFLTGASALIVAIGMTSGDAIGQRPSEASPLGVPGYPNVDSWLALDANGNVIVSWGKVEQGTGIETAIAQIVADELDVAFDSVRVLQGDTDRTPDQGYTAGSQSLSVGAIPVRRAAAALRASLVEIAAQRLNVAADALTTSDGAIIAKTNPQVRISYAKLVPSGRVNRVIPSDVALKPASAYQVVGRSVPRVDIPAKLDGSYRYVQNVRLPGMMHARMVHPQRLGQVARAIDLASLGDVRSKVRVVHKSAFVAVVAQREWDAVQAAKLLKVSWEGGAPLPAEDRLDAALRATPGTDQVVLERGNVSSASGKTLRATYHWPFQSHGSIGPSCGLADVRDDGVTIWSGTEGSFFLKRSIAALLGRSGDEVVVRWVEASGAYGHNGADDAAAAAAIVSQEIRKPVRMQWMRYDETAWDPKGPAMLFDLEAVLDRNGRIAAWSYHGRSPTHQGRPNGSAGSLLAGRLIGLGLPPPFFIGGDRNAPTNYDIPNQRIVMTNLSSSALRQSALRGLGGTPNSFANESFVDELAHAAGADPMAFRLQHLSDPRAQAVLESLRPAYAPGRGVAFVRYENVNAYVAAVVDLQVDRKSGDVALRHVWIAHDCGLVVNPNGLRNQIEGNVIQGSSRALRERVRFTAAGVTSVDWLTYPILRFSDVPEISVTLIDRPDQPIMGAGEATTTVMAPAIANAIFAQTGARLRSVPFTPEAVKAALQTS